LILVGHLASSFADAGNVVGADAFCLFLSWDPTRNWG
jgi:hypothetical protein